MAAPEQFEGFMVHSADKWSDFTKEKVISPAYLVICISNNHSSLPRSSRNMMSILRANAVVFAGPMYTQLLEAGEISRSCQSVSATRSLARS